MKLRKKTIIAIIIGLFLVFLSTNSYATEIDWPKSPLTNITLDNKSTLEHLVAYVYGWGIGLGGLFAFTVLLIAGIRFMMDTGSGSQKKEAIEKIRNAVLGLVFLLSSWLILNTINPQMTSLTPISSIWEDMINFKEIVFFNSEAPPCAFAILYTGENFSGGKYRLGVGESTKGGSIEVTENFSTTATTGRGIQQVAYSTNTSFLSGKGFVSRESLDDQQKKMVEEAQNEMRRVSTSTDENYTPSTNVFFGLEIIDNYIEYPGACILTISSDHGLFTSLREIGIIPLPSANFSEGIWENKKPTLYQVRSANRSL
jgi:hypothetical protein